MDYFPIAEGFKEGLEIGNFVLTLLFTVEMALKLGGLGLRGYVYDSFNVFDGVIVIISLVEIFASPPAFLQGAQPEITREEILTATEPREFAGGGGAVSAFRTFRLFRVFKLARSWKSLNQILNTIALTLKDVANFAVLLFIIMYIFALMGGQFFANRYCFDDQGSNLFRVMHLVRHH